MILQIDATVTGPDGIATGSAAVTVNEEAQAAPAPTAQAEAAGESLAALRARQRAALRRNRT